MGWAEIAVSPLDPRVPDIPNDLYTKQFLQGWPVNSPKKDALKNLSSVFPSFCFPASRFRIFLFISDNAHPNPGPILFYVQ